MFSDRPDKKKTHIKTGFLERRLELAKAGMVSATRYAGHSALDWMYSKEEREIRAKRNLSAQAEYLVEEMGKLKGSVVKIGQMMALYGKFFLPKEVTDAFHNLESKTPALDWEALQPVVVEDLGQHKYDELEVDPEPLAAASIGQVHRGRLPDGTPVCIKVQYPGIRESIDADLNAVISLMKMGNLLKSKPGLDCWLEDIRELLHQEVDYGFELDKTQWAAEELAEDKRYRVPTVFPAYSSARVLVTSFEEGFAPNDPEVAELSQDRRNKLGLAQLDLFLKETFQWGKVQTDPNFGNYRISIGGSPEDDQLVLLDFGALKEFSLEFMTPFRALVGNAFYANREAVAEYVVHFGMFKSSAPSHALENLVDVLIDIIEPVRKDHSLTPADAFNANGEYHWKASRLPRRVAKKAAKAFLMKSFSLPPKEFFFMYRKLMGVYTFMMALDAQFNSGELMEAYVESALSS